MFWGRLLETGQGFGEGGVTARRRAPFGLLGPVLVSAAQSPYTTASAGPAAAVLYRNQHMLIFSTVQTPSASVCSTREGSVLWQVGA